LSPDCENSPKTKTLVNNNVFFSLRFSNLQFSCSGDHPWHNLDKFGYKQNMKVRNFEHPSVGYVLESNVESGDFVQKCDFVKIWQLENPRKHFYKHFSQK
jgi:hypothetical protein